MAGWVVAGPDSWVGWGWGGIVGAPLVLLSMGGGGGGGGSAIIAR